MDLVVDASCCPLMQFRPIVRVEKSKFASIGLLDSTHPHTEDVTEACAMLMHLRSGFAKRTVDALHKFVSHLQARELLRREIRDVYAHDAHILRMRTQEAHVKSLKVFE